MAEVIPTHTHPVVDTARPFTIDPVTKEIKAGSNNLTLPQRSKNSERFTFTIPGTTIEGHDMTLCNSVMIHFRNIGQETGQLSKGIYKVKDLTVANGSVTLSWLIDEEATLYAGGLLFSIHFICTAEDGSVVYDLPTLSYSRITVGPTVWNSDTIAKEHPDIIAELDGRISALEPAIVLYPDIHAEYFTITEDGVLSLKPEYRGASTRTEVADSISDNGTGVAGSKNAELPKNLIIPEIVNDTFVDSLAVGIFLQNLAIERVVLPSTITALPDRCFDKCWYLREVCNTEKITSLGNACFQQAALKKAYFPNLQTLGVAVFINCGRLVYADLGKINSISQQAFTACSALNAVKNSGTITSVGDNAFNDTFRLKKADFIGDLTSIGKYAFYSSKVDYPWNTLTDCTFGTNATSAQLNPTDFWSACSFAPCENPLPTHLSQSNPLWAGKDIGTSQRKYEDGCTLFVAMHIYCGIKNLTLSSPEEFADIVNAVDPNLLNNFAGTPAHAADILNALGLTATVHTAYNQTALQAVYTALANGGYVYLTTGTLNKTNGHAVTAYGIDSNGELMIADSASNTYDDRSIPIQKGSLHYKKFLAPSGAGFVIVAP